jgi:hypothetical protein
MAVLTVRPLARSIHFALDPTTLTGTFTGATIEWRVPGGSYAFGQPFVRMCPLNPLTKNLPVDPRWGTILPGAEEGTAYEYRVSMEGVTDAPITGTTTTLSVTAPTVSPVPDPLNLTTSDTVSTAVNLYLSATPADNRGKEILFAAGTYRQAPFTNADPLARGGDASGWVTFRPKDGDEGLVIFDGSDETYDVIGGGLWSIYTSAQITAAMKIYRTAWTAATDLGHLYYEDATGNPCRLLWASKDQMSGGSLDYWSSGLYTLNSTGTAPGTGYAAAHGRAHDDSLQIRAISAPTEGCYCVQGGYIYVHLPNGIDPETVRMKVPELQRGWVLRGANYVKTKGITFQYFGVWDGIQVGGAGDMNPKGGVGVDNTTGCVFEDVTVRGFGQSGFSHDSNSYRLYSVLFKDCKVQQYGLDPYSGPLHSWHRVKGSNSEAYGWWIIGDGVSIIDCEVRGAFNGVDSGCFSSSGFEGNPNKYSQFIEVDNCEFIGIPDDAIEPDLFSTSFVASRNKMVYCYKGISLAPMESGPIICVRNTYYNTGYYGLPTDTMKEAGTKFGNNTYEDVGWKLYAHNTIVNAHTAWQTAPGVGISSEGQTQNLNVYNNYTFSDYAPVDFANGRMGYPHSFDRNFYATPGQTMVASGIGLWVYGRWAMARGQYKQGDNAFRSFDTFLDWQQGNNRYASDADMPGYTLGVIPTSPVTASTAGCTVNGIVYPAQASGWLHDPNSVYDVLATSGLTSPATDDFSIADYATRLAAGELPTGEPLVSINYDCLPGWAAYEETTPTVGAVPFASSPPVTRVPTTLRFTVEPSSVVKDVPFYVTVEVLDQFGVRYTAVAQTVSLMLTSGLGTLWGSKTRTTTAGVVQFTGLTLDTVGYGFTLYAYGTGLTADTTAPFNVTEGTVTPGVATTLRFTAEPGTVEVGLPFAVAVEVLDGDGVRYLDEPVSVTLTLTAGTGLLGGTLTKSTSNGVAIFGGLTINAADTDFVLTASSGTLTVDSTTAFTVSAVSGDPPVASSLLCITQPLQVVKDAPFDVVYQVRDQYGEPFEPPTLLEATISVESGAGTLSGTLTIAASGDTITFSGLSLDTEETATLQAIAAGLPAASAAPIVVVAQLVPPGTVPASLLFSGQPTEAIVSQQTIFGVQVLDANGVICPTSGASITIALTTGTGTMGGMLTRTADADGALFTGITFDTVGTGKVLTATSGTLTHAHSNPFRVIAAPDPQGGIYMDRDLLVKLFRTRAATIMGVDSLAEAGNGGPLSAHASPFGAYRVISCNRVWNAASYGLGANDNPFILQIELFYMRKRTAADESLSTMRVLLDQFAAALNGDPPAWATYDRSVLYCHVVTYTEGSGNEYSAIFSGGDTWVAGSLSCELLFCL